MKLLFNLLILVSVSSAFSVSDVRASTDRHIVVSGKIMEEEGSGVPNFSVQVCESKAGFLVMREKVLSNVTVNSDGTFKTPPLRHRSSWSLILRVNAEGYAMEQRTIGFDAHNLDRSRRYASGQVYVDAVIIRKSSLRK